MIYDQPMPFGKWKSHAIIEIAAKDPKYCLWARTGIKGKYGRLLFNAVCFLAAERGMLISEFVKSR